MIARPLTFAVVLGSVLACGMTERSAPSPEPMTETGGTAPEPSGNDNTSAAPNPGSSLGVLAVSTSGESGNYRFSVTLLSEDTGCERYADWWEVLTPEGDLLYRRILTHSHVDEQPFTRGGGPVGVTPAQTVIVRGHDNDRGYYAQGMRGSVEAGFATVALEPDFAPALAADPPQPNGCAF